jgi:hypothetical protein
MVLHHDRSGATRSDAGALSCAFATNRAISSALFLVALLAACSGTVDGNGGPTSSTGGSAGVGGSTRPEASTGTGSSSGSGGGGAEAGAGGRDGTGGGENADAAPSVQFEGGSFNGTFRHPGALLTGEQIAFLKAKIAAGAEPWASAFKNTKSSSMASLSYTAHPHANVICGSASASPDGSCGDEKSDSVAAYTHALIWALGGEMAHAQKAIQIMNAWSPVLKMHSNSNTPLQCGWVGTLIGRAAELIVHTSGGWAQSDVDQYAAMLKNAYLPNIIDGALKPNGNWELSTVDALIQIAVFLDDKASFEKALLLWRRRVPAYIYLKSDGPDPVKIPGMSATWYGPQAWVDGFAQETCRDLTHTQWAFGAMINAAETALIQGVDLYAEESTRILAGLELHAGFLTGAQPPPGICGSVRSMSAQPMWEIAYNHYANRVGKTLPNMNKLIMRPGFRPTDFDHHLAWETLTHAEIGDVGFH